MAITPIEVITTNETIPAGAIYASPSGISSNTGAIGSPVNLQTAVTKASATGSTIVLRGGTYRVATISLTKSIKFVAYPGEKPVLSGARQIIPSSFTAEGTLYYTPHTVTFPNVGAEFAPAGSPIVNLQQLFVNDEKYTQVASKGELVAKTFYVQEATSTVPGRIYVKDNLTITGLRIEASDKEVAFDTLGGSAGTTFVGIGFEKYANYPAQVDQNSVTFDRCTGHLNGRYGFTFKGGRDLVIKGCIASYNGMTGIGNGFLAKNYTIEKCKIYGNNTSNFRPEYGAGGIKIQSGYSDGATITQLVQGGIVRDNEVYNHPKEHGIWFDNFVMGVEVYRNECHNNATGIFFEASGHESYLSYIVDNLVYGNTYGLYTSHSAGVRFWNNTAVMNAVNERVHDGGRVQGKAALVAMGNDYRTRDVEFVNNLCDSSRSPSSTGSLVETAGTRAGASMVSRMSNNAYYRRAANQPANIYKWYVNGASRTYTNITDFKAAVPGYETGSIGRTAEATNPFLNDDYTVKSTSPTKGAGAAVTGRIAAILGVAPGTVVDIGRITGSAATPPIDPPPTDACQVRIDDALNEQLGDIQLLNDTLNARTTELAAANASISTLTAEKAALQEQLATANTTISQRDATIAQKDATISSLNADKVTLQNQVSTLQSQVDSGTAALAKLDEVKTQLENTLLYIG